MDGYKKKKSAKKAPAARKKLKPMQRQSSKTEEIKMASAGSGKKKSGKVHVNSKEALNVILGRREENRRKRIFILSFIALLLIAVLIFCLSTPTGPFEYLQTSFKMMGSGNLPAAVSGSEIINIHNIGSQTFVLTDTHAEIFSDSGKKVLSRQHEFNSPALCVSEQRAIIFDRGGKSAFVFNCNDVLHEYSLEHDIYCADIGRNGTVAIATKSSGYASQVEVFDKSQKSKFTWYSSTALINDVAVSNNGKMIAVATVDVSSGGYKSKVSVFKFTSASPVYTFEYDGELIYSLDCISGSHFSVTTSEGIDYIKWAKGIRERYENEYSLSLYRYNKNSLNVTVTGNKSSSIITVYSKKGAKKAEFSFGGAVSDISATSKRIYILSDGYLHTLDYNGNVIVEKINVSGYSRIVAIGDKDAMVIGNYGIDKINATK